MSEVVMCSKCKTWVSPGAKTCPKCGAPIVSQEMLNQAAEQKDEAQKDKERLMATIASLILFLVIAIAWIIHALSPEYEESFFTALFQGIIMGWAFGTFPCGMDPAKIVCDKTKVVLVFIPIGPVLWVWLAIVTTMFAGFVMFPVNLIRIGFKIFNKKKDA
ncbi:MAG: hypothetical protein IJ716_08670 [Lachnospiraceae bacterium]|nr:hypothetical protein [Lachnospiraceae bacterium]